MKIKMKQTEIITFMGSFFQVLLPRECCLKGNILKMLWSCISFFLRAKSQKFNKNKKTIKHKTCTSNTVHMYKSFNISDSHGDLKIYFVNYISAQHNAQCTVKWNCLEHKLIQILNALTTISKYLLL